MAMTAAPSSETPTQTEATCCRDSSERSTLSSTSSSSDTASACTGQHNGIQHHVQHEEESSKETTTESRTTGSSRQEATATSSTPTQPLYNPNRVFTPQQLEVLQLVIHPVWVFDIENRCMKWANASALEVWNASSLTELQQRNFADMSDATIRRLKEYQGIFLQGGRVSDQWTVYPRGQAKQLQIHCSGIRLDAKESMPSMLVEGTPLVKDVKDEVMNETIRGVEMLRHLSVAVCQFDLSGRVMFQNPIAIPAQVEDENEANVESNGTTKSHKDSDAKGSTSNPANREDSSINRGNIRRSGDFVDRFVDPNLGRQLLEKLQSAQQETEQEVDLEAEIQTNNGPRWNAIQLRKTLDPVTGQPAILYSARDISDKVQAKKERKEKEQKSEFLAIMAHEIRTPLHQIIGFIDLLDQTTELDREQRSYVKLLKSCAHGLLTVISDVLDYSKLEAGKMHLESIPYEPKSVLEATLEAVRASCEEKGIYLTFDWNKDIPFKLLGDPNRLRQVLLNLLSNAVKFTKKGGIHVLVQFIPGSLDSCNRQQEKQRKLNAITEQRQEDTPALIKFIVKDTGMGILPEHQSLIFHRYNQGALSIARKHGGTGLGLSICKLLVKRMGGTIGVESEFGQGSSFWFCLPAEIPNEPDAAEAADDELVSETEGLKILVAEDNKINQKLVKRMLERLGHTPTIVENGKEAIELIDKDHKFDLVLMDIQMPVMDGLEATRRLRMLGYSDLPIIGLTASVARSDFTELGFDDWLAKPVPMKALKMKLHHLRQSRQ